MRKFAAAIVMLLCLFAAAEGSIISVKSVPNYQWQKEAAFPDWLGRTDDTLAINIMISFMFWHGQGKIYLKVSPHTKSFVLFVNGHSIDTSSAKAGGTYEVDISGATVNGINTLQLSSIKPTGIKDAVKVFVPYPVIIDGKPQEEAIRTEALELVAEIISSDIAHGFPGAQLAVIRNGRLIYSNSFGKTNTTDPNSPKVTRDTLYDLASVTKVLSVNYAVQKLMTEGRLDVDTKIADIFGSDFLDSTIRAKYQNTPVVDAETMRKWKAEITIRDVMCHRAGYPPEIHYYDKNYDLSQFKHNKKANNPLYSGITPSAQTRANTLCELLKTPLMYKPRTKIVYSDVDFMLMCFVVEKVSGKTLDVYLAENFLRPMGLTHVTFNPLRNGFTPEDCAATEINGNMNTRGYAVKFEGLRDYVLRGEVDDEKAYHSMDGVSGHAGLFANAEDAARMMSVMLTGGYGRHKFFSRNVIDMFTSPQNKNTGQWAIGWWREGDNGRPMYFGTQSSSGTFGHQGFTGTLVFADPSRNLVIAYFTNKLNTPALMPLRRPKTFAGNWFTASTLGFAVQILGMGLDSEEDISYQLTALLEDMTAGSERLIPKGAGKNHPAVKNAESKRELLRRWQNRKPAGDS